MNLFRLGDFTLHSGVRSRFKIDCDALTDDDWQALAFLASQHLPVFSHVCGIPRGGDRFAAALAKYAVSGADDLPILIVDDVLTTGGSMRRERDRSLTFRAGCGVIGCVVFARGSCPDWVTPLFAIAPSKEGS